ncbi:MAG: NAD(P)-dependent oxidoreductase [Candidatus Poribacteria bacterium]|nr:NAD(P)-dependent oxidoreductase [Candidatus Poribacteria bacterium]
MNVLITGGAGHVATILRPYLEAEHNCTYFDVKPVKGAEAQTIIGDITDADAVSRAIKGCGAVIQLVMAPLRTPNYDELAYDIHVKSMHLVLKAAVEHGVYRVIYASSMSVYKNCGGYFHETEDETPTEDDIYGFTKRLGEDVCRVYTLSQPELSVLAIRMVLPQSAERWAELKASGKTTNFMTAPGDLGRLYLAGLALTNHRGFDAVHACTDFDREHLNLAKAKRLLGWEPRGE